MPASIERGQYHGVEEGNVRIRVEVFGLVVVSELAGGRAHGPQYLLTVALSFGGNMRLRCAKGPRLMQRGRLAKGCLVGIHDYGMLRTGFFFKLGTV